MVPRVLLIAVALLIGATLAGLAVVFVVGKLAEPRYSGDLVSARIHEPVLVRYGRHAVPSIEAESIEDLVFAQGYVLASERMWQMDLLRRLATGRLAEVMGEQALAPDRFFRTIGLAHAADASFDALEPRYRRYLDAYAAGVNAYQASAAWRPPLEYLLAGFHPAPWRPQDSLAIAEYMAWMLSFDARDELVYLRMAARLGPKRALELFPTDEGIPAPDYAQDLPAYAADYSRAFDMLLAMPARLGLPVPGAASNAWAVNGERTAHGEALLANDPHLAATMPGLWYELELRAPGLHAAGVALPGAPFVVIGHNDDLAWGFTTTMADTQDIFVERLTADGLHVERAGSAPEAVGSRVESIRVKGRPAPIELHVRTTSNGVIINDVLGPATGTPMDLPACKTSYLLALRTTLAVPDRAVAGLYQLNTATTLAQAREVAADFRHASQNLMLAHRDGGIAWQVTGLLPQRGRGTGTFPVPGWEAGWQWTGYVSPEQNPGLTDPPGYALLTANNRTIPVDYPVSVSRSWSAPYRAQRIEQLLSDRNPLSPQYLARMQLDRVSIEALRFRNALRRVAPQLRLVDPEARRIADELLMSWDGRCEPDSRAAAFFVLLKPALYSALYGDELGEDLPALMAMEVERYSPLDEVMYSGRSTFWDDVRTPEREGPAQIWARALHSARAELYKRIPGPGDQRLDRLRHLVFRHAFDRIHGLGRFFDVGPIPLGGDSQTINVAKASPLDPEDVLIVPSCRVVYTPTDWQGTRGTLPLGQSGHRFSPYRTDQLDDWLAGRTHPWPWNGPRIGTTIGIVLMRPAGDRGGSPTSSGPAGSGGGP
jgi:acyl-homoserine lactone acylase PvdQ